MQGLNELCFDLVNLIVDLLFLFTFVLCCMFRIREVCQKLKEGPEG